MSAADPADLTPPRVNGRRGAAVIDITKRATARTAVEALKGRWNRVDDTDPDVTPITGGRRDSLRQLADTVEKGFNASGLSLADDSTAAAYRVTLDWVGRALEGAQAQDIISSEQREELAALIDGMKAAPGLV